MLATDHWCIKVLDKVYGPYTQSQMANFVEEGRLTGQSLVSPAGGKQFREARQYPPLVEVLSGKMKKEKAFGKAQPERNMPKIPPEGALANVVVIFDSVIGTAGKVEERLRALGTAFRMTQNVWVLSTTQSAIGVRNALAPHLDVREPVFVIDCSRGRTSWSNLAPELHAKMTKAWISAEHRV